MKQFAVLVLILLLAGCVSNAPKGVQSPVGENISVAMVQNRSAQYMGVRVRWGGEIISVENRAQETWLEVLSRPLASGGRPYEDAKSKGRFLVRVGRFLDPAEYTPGQTFTATGRLVETREGRVGEYAYLFPVMKADSYYLWPELQDSDYYYDRYDRRYDRRYDPFYRHYPYPYYDPWGRPRHKRRF